jgi:hypothetical protein
LEKLRNEDLVHVQRESTFLRYTANTDAVQELLQFLTRSVVREIKLLYRKISFRFANRGMTMGTADIKEAVKEKYGQAALRVKTGEKAYCGASPATGKATIELGLGDRCTRVKLDMRLAAT